MEQGTPIKKLKGLEFYVYLYALDSPRRYTGGSLGSANDNTIGFGYYGKDGCIRQGLDIIGNHTAWLKDNLQGLAEKYGREFPDRIQYEFFGRFEADISTTIGYHVMNRGECDQYISEVLMRNGGKTPQTNRTRQRPPVTVATPGEALRMLGIRDDEE